MGIFMGLLQISCDRHARMTDLSHLFPSVVPYLSSAWCPGKFAGIPRCEVVAHVFHRHARNCVVFLGGKDKHR